MNFKNASIFIDFSWVYLGPKAELFIRNLPQESVVIVNFNLTIKSYANKLLIVLILMMKHIHANSSNRPRTAWGNRYTFNQFISPIMR